MAIEAKNTNFRWVVVSLLFLITLINYIDRASIAYAIPDISKEFHLSEDKVGLLLGIFSVGYIFTTFLGGLSADKFGTKWVLSISMLGWSIASILTGFAGSFITLLMARILLGIAEGPNFPSMTRAVSDWLPEEERNRALAFALIAVPLSLALSGPVVSQLITYFTWRGSYFILASLILVWLPVWWILFRNHPRHSSWVNEHELNYIIKGTVIKSPIAENKGIMKQLLCNRTLIVNNWASFVFGYYLFFFMTWLPNYLSQHFHLDLIQIGLYSAVPWLLAAIMMWFVSKISDKIYIKTGSLRLSRSYPIFLSQLISALFVIPCIFSNNVFSAMFCISLAVGFLMCANAQYYAVNIDVAKEHAGTALGITATIFALAGFIAPSLTGLIITVTGQFNSAFWLMAGLAISSALLTFIFHNRDYGNNR